MSTPSLAYAERVLAQIDGKDAKIARLEARVAELEAAARPVPFAEREPNEGDSILTWNGCDWEATTHEKHFGYRGSWLPMPPAPGGAV